MDEQTVLLTSIRDILTRIERVLDRIEAQGAAASEAVAPRVAAPSINTKSNSSKWRSR